MKVFDKEIMVIPAGKTLTAIENPKCRLYECPAGGKNYKARARTRPLYVAFAKNSQFKTLYKVQDVLYVDLTDNTQIAHIANIKDAKGNEIYKDFQNRVSNYLKIFPLSKGCIKALFVIDGDNSIELKKAYSCKSTRNHHFLTLKEVFDP